MLSCRKIRSVHSNHFVRAPRGTHHSYAKMFECYIYFSKWVARSVCVFIATTLLRICIGCSNADAASQIVRKKSSYSTGERNCNLQWKASTQFEQFYIWFILRGGECNAARTMMHHSDGPTKKLPQIPRENMNQSSNWTLVAVPLILVFIQISLFSSERNHKLMNRLIRNHSAFDAQRDYKLFEYVQSIRNAEISQQKLKQFSYCLNFN